jgi:hypothetical protein
MDPGPHAGDVNRESGQQASNCTTERNPAIRPSSSSRAERPATTKRPSPSIASAVARSSSRFAERMSVTV